MLEYNLDDYIDDNTNHILYSDDYQEEEALCGITFEDYYHSQDSVIDSLVRDDDDDEDTLVFMDLMDKDESVADCEACLAVAQWRDDYDLPIWVQKVDNIVLQEIMHAWNYNFSRSAYSVPLRAIRTTFHKEAGGY